MSGDLASALFDTNDLRPWTTALVLSVDDVHARVTVNLDGAAVSLRRVVGSYRVGDSVAVVRDPDRSGAGQFVAGIVGPAVAPAAIWLPGVVTAINTGTSRLTVTVAGVSMVLPYVSGTYTVSGPVAVLHDPASVTGGVVMGPLGNPPAAPTPPALPPVPDVPSAPTVGTFTALVLPTWSGSWRSIRSAYDRWNTSSYGGASSLYQGDAFGSGAMTGVAVYGNQVVGLGAIAITAMTVHSVIATGSGTPVFQGTPQGSAYPSAPTPSGSTASGTGDVDLVASGIAEAMRTGAVKGLCTGGSSYLAVRGTSLADGMALAVTYTKAI